MTSQRASRWFNDAGDCKRLMGPNLLFHLSEGWGGMQHFIEHLTGPINTYSQRIGGRFSF
jgi:hypothetical protein